jgi:methanogenic corrinoid protein MtbC1
MFAALAASRKWRTCYLGADLPPEEISNFATRVEATAVAVSLVLPETLDCSIEKLHVLRSGLPSSVELWIGGAASFYVDPALFPAGSVHMAGRKDFENRLDLLVSSAR